jgi:hypothetical protein
MRMILSVTIPHEPFNTLAKKGTAGTILNKILESNKPEAAYFTEQDGHRGAILIVNLNDPSQVPALAEPWFLEFQADCKFRIVMTAEDLGRSGLDQIGKKWG